MEWFTPEEEEEIMNGSGNGILLAEDMRIAYTGKATACLNIGRSYKTIHSMTYSEIEQREIVAYDPCVVIDECSYIESQPIRTLHSATTHKHKELNRHQRRRLKHAGKAEPVRNLKPWR